MTLKEGDLILCETVVAITVHARRLGPKGPQLLGGYDTDTLCGVQPGWDIQTPFRSEHLRCKGCRKARCYHGNINFDCIECNGG